MEIDVTHAWSVEVRVVGVEMDGPFATGSNNVGDRLPLARHGLHIKVQLAERRPDELGQVDPGGGGEHEVAFRGPERLQADRHAEFPTRGDRRMEHFGGIGLAIGV